MNITQTGTTGQPFQKFSNVGAYGLDYGSSLDATDYWTSHDTHLDQLRHRRDTLPERAELEAQSEELARLDAGVGDAEGRKATLVTQQRRLEDEVAMVEAKVAQVDQTLYRSGTITSPKEAQALSDELASLGKRQRRLEDDVIELMEQIEPIDAELADLGTQRAELGTRMDATRSALASIGPPGSGAPVRSKRVRSMPSNPSMISTNSACRAR